jgi:hypothetical protein
MELTLRRSGNGPQGPQGDRRVEHCLDHRDRLHRRYHRAFPLARSEHLEWLHTDDCARDRRRVRHNFYRPNYRLVSARSGCGAHRRDRRCCARAVCLESICRHPRSRRGRYSRAWPIATPLALGIKRGEGRVGLEAITTRPSIGWVGSGVSTWDCAMF